MYVSRLAAAFLALCLIACPAGSRAAQPVLQLLLPNSVQASQCANLLRSAEDAPVRFGGIRPLYLLTPNTHNSLLVAGMYNFKSQVRQIDLPFIFRDLAHFQAFQRSPLFEEEASKTPIARPLALAYSGSTYLISKKPLRTPGDLNGLKMHFPNGTFEMLENFRLWGARRVGESFSTMVHLKGGYAGAAAVTLLHIIDDGLTELAPHINLFEMQRLFLAIAVTVDVWQDMDASQRQALSAWAKRMADRCSAQNFDAETRAIETLKKQGVTIVEPNKQAFESLRPDPTEGVKSEEGKAFIRRIQAIR